MNLATVVSPHRRRRLGRGILDQACADWGKIAHRFGIPGTGQVCRRQRQPLAPRSTDATPTRPHKLRESGGLRAFALIELVGELASVSGAHHHAQR